MLFLNFEFLVDEGTDECVEGAVLLSLARGLVYGSLRVWLADLFLEARFVVV